MSACADCHRLRLQIERWQDVAYVDGADVADRARREGITTEQEGNPTDEFLQFIREFEARP